LCLLQVLHVNIYMELLHATSACRLKETEDRWMPVRWPKVPYGHPAQVAK
jgi:hypothetical protein